MTEDEAIGYMRNNGYLYDLPEEFWTKEFVLKVICEYDYSVGELEITKCRIKIDYDILLAIQILHHKHYGWVYSFKSICTYYGKYLTQSEITKLHTTLKLIIG